MRSSCLLLSACTLVLYSQPKTEIASRSKEIERWLSYARLAPAELGADILLRIESSPNVLNRELRDTLLEAAFEGGARSAEPVAKRFAEGAAESLSTFENEAFHLGTDALSLQSRAVRALVVADPRRARELWAEINFPTLKPLSCDDALVYDVSPYYEAWAAVLDSARVAPQRERDPLFERFREHLLYLSSPAQIQPLARVLMRITLSAQERQRLIDAFLAGISFCVLDSRQFGADFSMVAKALGALADKTDEATRNKIVRTARTLVMRHMGLSGCVPWRGVLGIASPAPLAIFNSELLPRASDPTIREVVPNEGEGRMADSRLTAPRSYWRDSRPRTSSGGCPI